MFSDYFYNIYGDSNHSIQYGIVYESDKITHCDVEPFSFVWRLLAFFFLTSNENASLIRTPLK